MPVMTREYPSPDPSLTPNAPPPSLVSDENSTISQTKHYARHLLLSLGTPKAPPPIPQRLASFSEILRKDSSSDWGINEEHADIFDDQPPLKGVPISIERQQELMGGEGQGHPADLLFNYRSTPGDAAVPILIDFANPNPFIKSISQDKASGEAGLDIPGSADTQKTLIGESVETVGSQLGAIRLGARLPSTARSTSPALSDVSSRKRSDSFLSNGILNPFAAPWQAASTKIKIPSGPPSLGHSSPASDSGSDCGSLPLPRTLPSSLPKKPQGGLPPVFVKRESAALPQSMALPDIAPMGEAWEGDNNLSGNERRRRASGMVDMNAGQGLEKVGLMRLGTSIVVPNMGVEGGGSLGDTRPARLLNLGQRIRANSLSMGETGKTVNTSSVKA